MENKCKNKYENKSKHEALKEYLNKRLAPSSVKRYLKEIQTYLSKTKEAKSANYGQVVGYIGKCRTINNNVAVTLHALQHYYGYLVHIGIRTNNPAKAIKLRDRKNRAIQIQDLFTSAELEKLLDRKERYRLLKNRNKIIISLLIYQGLTNSEIKNLRLDDINLEQGTVYIKAGRRTNKRTLQLKANQVYWIMEYLNQDREQLRSVKTDKLIVSKKGTAESGEGISYLIETMKALYPDRTLNPKTIRQSVIINLLKAGEDLRIVQVFAGHKYPSTTERYRVQKTEALKQQIFKYHPLDQKENVDLNDDQKREANNDQNDEHNMTTENVNES